MSLRIITWEPSPLNENNGELYVVSSTEPFTNSLRRESRQDRMGEDARAIFSKG
jgi:hypothetical protein